MNVTQWGITFVEIWNSSSNLSCKIIKSFFVTFSPCILPQPNSFHCMCSSVILKLNEFTAIFGSDVINVDEEKNWSQVRTIKNPTRNLKHFEIWSYSFHHCFDCTPSCLSLPLLAICSTHFIWVVEFVGFWGSISCDNDQLWVCYGVFGA